jgi:glucose-6-phosphate isomerase
MMFDPALDIQPCSLPLGFHYGNGVTGPPPELRSLNSIRASLRNPNCSGPDPVYAIAMDVARMADHESLLSRMLLFGVVTFAAGRLGEEPVRSQGHVHRVSVHSGWSPPELYEIWSGRAVIVMQEHAADHAGHVYAVEAGPGEKVLVPPGWAHATVSADVSQPLTFGALCDREYGFEYAEVRRRNGLAWDPLAKLDGPLTWEMNPAYKPSRLETKSPRSYTDFGVDPALPLYEQVRTNPDRLQWISKPGLVEKLWNEFVP